MSRLDEIKKDLTKKGLSDEKIFLLEQTLRKVIYKIVNKYNE